MILIELDAIIFREGKLYAIEPIDQHSPLTEEEESGIVEGLDELDAEGIPLTEVVRAIRRSMPDDTA
ncbi:MAG TPA: hypothetical protein VJ692_02740 [Nitrospiraceae bacterium]|nr:hypothetical protein [Nitrospiraceae bacterium]